MFDSVEWEFLWKVLESFWFGPNFIGWLKSLYRSPVAKVLVNWILSSPFPRHRGTRQGCLFSLGLFALAIEPLAILLQQGSRVKGIRVGPLQRKLSLYADDALLYLQDADMSLRAALDIIDSFGRFSEVRINWEKSVLFSLSPLGGGGRIAHTPLQWVEESSLTWVLKSELI